MVWLSTTSRLKIMNKQSLNSNSDNGGGENPKGNMGKFIPSVNPTLDTVKSILPLLDISSSQRFIPQITNPIYINGGNTPKQPSAMLWLFGFCLKFYDLGNGCTDVWSDDGCYWYGVNCPPPAIV